MRSERAHGPGVTIEGALGLELLRTMTLIRRFEEVAQTFFKRGHIRGSVHLAIGQEAVPAGVCAALRGDDLVTATYRGHGQALALGVDPAALMSEMTGRTTGVCGGRAGSMNVIDREHGLLGCFGIVGGSIAAATGAAIAQRRRADGGIAVAFFGDGAANQGYFFECLNFAAVLELPLLLVCENNLYMEFTRSSEVTAGSIGGRAESLGVPAVEVDGQDVVAVYEQAAAAVTKLRDGGGPVLIEALTYRYNDHARGDPVDYRPDGELAAWQARDPIPLLADRLAALAADVEQVRQDVEREIDRVQEAALAAPFPDPSLPGVLGTEFKPEALEHV